MNFLNKNNVVKKKILAMFHFTKLLYYTPYTQIKHLRILTVMPYDFPRY